MLQLAYSLDGVDHVVVLDASVNEQHQTAAQITDHPVETGANITDHIRPLPIRLTIEGVVTNTPIKAQVLSPTRAPAGKLLQLSGRKYIALEFEQSFDRVRDVYGDLFEACRGGALIEVTTSLSRYVDMAIQNLAIPRNAQNSNSIQFTIDMQEVITVDVNVVDTPAAKATNAARKDRGNKPTEEAAPEEKKSLSAAAVDALAAFAGKR